MGGFYDTRERVQAVLDEISYRPGWSFVLGEDGSRFYLQVAVTVESDSSLDSALRDGTRTPWRGGKRYLSSHMCLQEIVGVAFSAIKDAEEHEMREWFRYRGASIFNPHLNPEVLAMVARKKESFVTRENAMSMEEGS